MQKLLLLPFKLTTGVSIALSVVFAFMAAVMWTAGQTAIMFIAPVIIYSLAGCAILAAAVATAATVVERGEWIFTRRAELRRDRTLATNEARMSDLESDRATMHLRAETRYHAATLRQIEQGYIHPAVLADAKFSAFPAAVAKHIEQAVPLLEAPQRQDLLPAITNCPNVLIVGGKGRGKTSLLQWLEWQRLNAGNVVTVLDSHAAPSQWAGQVIGAGRQYESIAAAMLDLNTMLDNRYVQRTQGKDNFSIVNTFIDEFTLLPGYLKALGFDIQKYSFSHLTEGRKVGLNCIWGSHSDRAKALGLEGATDLKECFDAIVYLKKVKGDYYAQVDFGEGIEDTRYNHPGPFTIDRPTSKVKILSLPAPATNEPESIAVSNWPKTKSNPEPERPGEPDKADVIRRLHGQGLTKTEIAQHFGYKSNSGTIFHEIKAALKDK